MTYEITEQDFLNMLPRQKCLGEEINRGTEKEGHSKCNSCQGNYFVGGECNYGGKHLLSDDVRTLNQNFKQFEVLENRQIQLTTAPNQSQFEKRKKDLLDRFQDLENRCDSDGNDKEFFKFTCIATTDAHSAFLKKMQRNLRLIARKLKRYQEAVASSTWEQLQEFKKKEEQLEKMQSEANQLMEQWRNETDPAEKRRLYALLTTKQREIAAFRAEMKKDPGYKLFSEEVGNELGDIVRKLWQGETDFLEFQEKEEKEENQKYLGFIPKKYGKKLMWGGIFLAIIIGLYFFVRWIMKET